MPELDDAYAIAAHTEGGADFPPRWAHDAAAFRSAMGDRASLDQVYGPSERMAYDWFAPEGRAAGTFIFVHGGYWRAFDRKSWSHFARGMIENGWAVAMPSYDLCPTVRIAGITQQIAQAVQVIAERSPGPLALSGHSAGGHLVARMCAPGMVPKAVLDRIRHVVPISPLADLEPLLRTAMNDEFRMDAGMARAESPVHQPVPDVPVTVWVGADERPALLEQSRWLSEAWNCDRVVVRDRHHFDVIDALRDPDSDLIRCLTGRAL